MVMKAENLLLDRFAITGYIMSNNFVYVRYITSIHMKPDFYTPEGQF
jgi:hypothetical protein